jgi:PrcB C-terminal
MNTINRCIKMIAPLSIGGCLLLSACSPLAQTAPYITTQPQATPQEGTPAVPGLQTTGLSVQPASTPMLSSVVGQPVEYEIVAQDAPLGTYRQEPLLLAVRGDGAAVDIPSDLPPGATQVLQAALDKKDAALYLLIYAGSMPSGGFSAQLDSLESIHADGNELLLARYHIQPPDPAKGATTAITFPYLIARVATDLLTDQVRFEATSP